MIQNIRGTQDILPGQSTLWHFLETRAREVFRYSLLALVQALGREIAVGTAPADRRVTRFARTQRPATSLAQSPDGDVAETPAVHVPPNPFDRLRARAAGTPTHESSGEARVVGAPGPASAPGAVLPRRIAVEARTPRPARV